MRLLLSQQERKFQKIHLLQMMMKKTLTGKHSTRYCRKPADLSPLPDIKYNYFQEYPELESVATRKGKYGCKDCSKSFHHKNDLVRHMNIHNGTKPYTCETCGKTFLRSDYLRLHVIKHQGVKPLKCELCERRFYDRSNLRQHMRTHTGEKPAMCPYCPHRCSQLSDMRKHLTIHTKEKAFQCDTCGSLHTIILFL